MARLDELREYKHVIVSTIKPDFTQVSVVNVPRQFYADWFDLVVRVAKIVYPPFAVPPPPDPIEFIQDSCEINPSTDLYYFISVDGFTVQGEGDFAVALTAYYGFQSYDGNDYIELKLRGIPSVYPDYRDVSSLIRFDTDQSLATFFIWAEPDQLTAIEKILVLH